MFGGALPTTTPSSLKPGSPQPTSFSRKIMILGFLPLFAAKLASLFIRNDGVGGSNPSCGTTILKWATFSAKGIDDATPTTVTLAAKRIRGCVEGEALSGAPMGPERRR
jgi:hypothetical protein